MHSWPCIQSSAVPCSALVYVGQVCVCVSGQTLHFAEACINIIVFGGGNQVRADHFKTEQVGFQSRTQSKRNTNTGPVKNTC